MKHYFIINPSAGIGQAEKNRNLFIEQLKAMNVDYELHRTLSKGETTEYVKKRAADGEAAGISSRFYAVGGDGTINDVASGLIGFEHSELAVMPCGSGNDFVRNFTHKEYFLDLKRQINGSSMLIDAIKYDGGWCVNMANLGVDCEIAARASVIKGGLFSGSGAYFKAILDILPKHETYRMHYVTDTEEGEETLILAAAANGCFCGGGFKSCPTASLTNGTMELCMIRPLKGLKLLSMLVKYRGGNHLDDKEADKYIIYRQCKKLRLDPLDSIRVCIDGEISEFFGTSFEVVPKVLRLSLPEGSEPIFKDSDEIC